MSINEWIIYGETGQSSKTMWAALSGARNPRAYNHNLGIPYDPDDFRRCLQFYRTCQLTRDDLQKVKEAFDWWAPFIDAWDEMTNLFEEEQASGKAPKLYDLMQKLQEQSHRIRFNS